MDKKYRCIAKIQTDHKWTGYVDVYYSCINGWFRCENDENVTVLKWIYIQEFDDDYQNLNAEEIQKETDGWCEISTTKKSSSWFDISTTKK